MPNWCNNYLVLKHPDTDMITRVMNSFETGLLNEFVPRPEELNIEAGYSPDSELEAQYKSNIEKYGAPHWYDWSIENWGTKWDIDGTEANCIQVNANTVELFFDTAWSPPIAAYSKLEELGFEVTGYYHEPGMVFAGKYHDGYDDYYEGWSSSQEATEILPTDIADIMGIVDQLEDWESEELESSELED